MARIRTWRGPEDDQVLWQAAAILASGGLVACPTETFYALAADVDNEAALDRVMTLKGRPAGKPLLVLVADREMAAQVASALPPLAERLISLFWPGPLTLILPARPGLAGPLTGGTGTIGVRQPGSALARRLLRIFGRPLTGTSANLSGQEPVCSATEVEQILGEALDLILADGPCVGGLPSTIVDATQEPGRILRAGAIPAEVLAAHLTGG